MVIRERVGRVALTAMLFGGMSVAQAEWKGKGELGAVLARGNTETATFNGKFDMSTEINKWKHAFGASALRSSSEDETTGDRFELHGQSEYSLTSRSYALGSLRYEDDKFSPFNYQAIVSAGVGYRFLDSETTKLSAEIGAGYRRTEDRLTAEEKSDAIARGGVNFEHRLTMNSEIFDKFLVEAGADNTFLQNEAGIKANINSSLALSIAHTVRHNTQVTPPIKNTDQLLTASIVFSF